MMPSWCLGEGVAKAGPGDAGLVLRVRVSALGAAADLVDHLRFDVAVAAAGRLHEAHARHLADDLGH